MKKIVKLLKLLILLPLVYIYFINIQLFHFWAEMFTVIIGFCMIIISINTYEIAQNGYFAFLVIAYGFFTSINLIHISIFTDLDIFNSVSFNQAVQTNMLQRYIEGFSLLISYKFIDRKINYKKVLYYYISIVIFGLLCIYIFEIFPQCATTQGEYTSFEECNQYIMLVIVAISMYLYYKKKDKINKNKDNYMMLAMFFTMIYELFFNFEIYYEEVGFFFGHIFKLLAFYFLYKAIVKATFKQPYNNLFIKLDKRNEELEIIKNDIEKSQRKYKTLIEFLPNSVFVRDGEKIIFANNTAVNLLKAKDEKDIIGKNIFNFICDHYKYIINDDIILKANNNYYSAEHKLALLNGNIIDIEVSEMKINFDDKMCNLVIISDKSERKSVQNLKLELTKKTEDEKIRVEFFSNIAHEIRTPINVIYSALQLEDGYIEQNDVESIQKYNKIIKQNCFRLLRICNNLIDITKIEVGFYKPTMKIYNIVELVEEMISSVAFYIQSNGMSIVFDTEIEEKYVKCDSDLMERIILNLLSNSIKYGNANGDIWVNMYDKDDEIIISIKDNGIGIPKDKQESVFERFTQIDKSFTRKCEGSGLGLALVKSFVKMQGGNISLISEEDKGCEFIITFPASEEYEEYDGILKNYQENLKIIEKVDIEFSDIYFNND